jgi:uncharacterized protein (DUF488 family)
LKTIYSVGHSSHDWSTFISLLDAAGIGVVIDVRSNQAARLPHFNRTALKERLNAVGIGYVFLGLELGGRIREGGVPDYEQMATSAIFAEGLTKVEEMAARTRPALMCSEHEPLSSRKKRRFLGLKREIRRRFPYRSYGKASIFLALFSGRWFR